MMHARVILASLIAATVACYSANALALDGDVGLEALGQVSLGGAPLSSLVDTETPILVPPETVPRFERSFVSVADSQAGVFEYASSADIGGLALKVFGTLTNSSGAGVGNPEIPLMRVKAEARDVITLASTLDEPYNVTLEMVINGSIFASGGSANAFANGFLRFGDFLGTSGTASDIYRIGDQVADELRVTRTVSGSMANMALEAFLSFSVFQLDAGATATGEFGNTALLTLELPPGVTLVGSQSGTFGVPIPEPEQYALMFAGLILVWVGVAARRRPCI